MRPLRAPDVTEIGSVPRCRFDPDLSRYADADKGVDTAISQSKVADHLELLHGSKTKIFFQVDPQ